ncbi:MAG TPA: Uma2 family endonuclease [Longimicrobium sp.]|jgi:Uma2 family endonuclease|nr:Uma2 family endonuclease [Longimicrobium sp.]
MSTQSAVRRWTYDEFARLPDDGNRYEIIGGELYVTPAPTLTHQKVVTRLMFALEQFIRAHGLGELYVGPVDVLFAEGDYLEPDLVFVRTDRTTILKDRGVEGAPDLVVEVLSPKTAARDRKLKRERYAHFGVAEYWIVDPTMRRIEVHRAGDDRMQRIEVATESLQWTPVPGGPTLTLNVPELFPPKL